MGIELVTGYAGKGHVSSLDVGRFNAGMIGNRACVLNTGNKFECTVIDRNHIEVASGDLVKDGRHFTIEEGAVEVVTLSNCQEGYKRKDVICIRYKKDASSGIETADLIVKEGTATTGTPIVPSCTSATLHQPATVLDEIALWTVELSGSQIAGIRPNFTILPNLQNIWETIYPIGSIYMSMSKTSPEVLFGGSWEAISGRFLLASSRSYASGETGGQETISLNDRNLPRHVHTIGGHMHKIPEHTHAASVAQAGEHTHSVKRAKLSASGTGRYTIQTSENDSLYKTEKAGKHTHSIEISKCDARMTDISSGITGSSGNGESFDIMPPYLAVNMWVRKE